MGFPFLGPQGRIFKSVCRQLEERGADVEDLWGSDPRRRRAVEIVSGIIAKHMGWPNTRFVPQDPFWIVMWDRYSTLVDELRHEDVRVDLESAFGTKVSRTQLSDWYAWPYGRVIDQLLQESVT
jgi:hypothetical protein